MSEYLYIHPQDPQPRLIKQAVHLIKQGAVVVYPTDSGYAIGCQIGDKNSLVQICRIREIGKDHNFTLMVRDLSELSVYARVENQAFRLLKNNTPGPYTFVLKGTKEVPKRLLNPKRKTIGLRVPANPIAQALLAELNEPMMSTSLILPGNELAESDPYEIEQKLGNQVGVIIDGGNIGEEPTTVIDMADGDIVIRRAGQGDTSPFEL
ncbi:MAG: threonylcarbamoyl-AMP synthase [Idiomarina sp.]|nr:threonylcarbamoyl-AMP synthase [Idiomarina sp.]